MVGRGWSIPEAYIERRYVSCAIEAGAPGAQDLCWKHNNAVLHLNGVSTELLWTGQPGQWRAKNDPRWKVQSHTGTYANGDNDNEYWTVTTPDGTVYEFGRGFNNMSTGVRATQSVWTVPVWGDDAGDPCHGGLGVCDQAWRWNLDRVVDPAGNRMAYFYVKELNSFRLRFYNTDAQYTASGRLSEIQWGLREGTAAEGTSRLLFGAEWRCAGLHGGCAQPTPTSANPSTFPDVPGDLVCQSNCTKYFPSFWTAKRYTYIASQVWIEGTGWSGVDRVDLAHAWVTTGEDTDADGLNEQTFWLQGLQRLGFSEGGQSLWPSLLFDGCRAPGLENCELLDSYSYDANGQMTSRPGDTAQQSMDWNVEHQLVEVTEGSDSTEFVYDADGARILRITPDDATLYIDGHELIDDGSTVTARRTYTLGNIAIAVRDGSTGQVSWLVGDHLGSTTVTVNNTTGSATHERYLPYGKQRTSALNPITDRGWIGQINDESTGLQYLNARYFETTMGRFMSPDLLGDAIAPGPLDSYGYGLASPQSSKDPTGLLPEQCLSQECYMDERGWHIGSMPAGSSYTHVTGLPSRPPRLDVKSPGRTTSVSSAAVEEIWSAPGQVEQFGKMAVGFCGSANASSGIAGSLAGCFITTKQDFGLTGSVGMGEGSPGVSVEVGTIFSNAQSIYDLQGHSVCVAGSAGSGVSAGATVCGGATSSGEYNGYWTVYPSIGASLEPGAAYSVTATLTGVERLGSTPWIVQGFLPDLGPADRLVIRNSDGSYLSGGQTPWTSTSGAPLPHNMVNH